jgi:hypothetical protein
MYLMDNMENMHEVFPVEAYDFKNSPPFVFALCPVDVKIMAVVIFIAKLFYKLDDSESWVPPAGNDLYIPPKDAWLAAFKASKRRWESNLLNGGKKYVTERHVHYFIFAVLILKSDFQGKTRLMRKA